MAINQDDTTTVANSPVPNKPNPALPPGQPIDVDDEELIDYNDGLTTEEIAALEAAKIQATKVALRDSLARNGLAMRKALRGDIYHKRLLCIANDDGGNAYGRYVVGNSN
jgi:hypothetical protein